MKQRFTSSQRGMSLVEVIVATVIFAIIFVAALMIYDNSNKVFKDSVEAGDLQQNTRVAFDTLVSDIRMAGFDYDRDGQASGTGVYQQPDEQFEFIGPRALTIRANFDYETDAASENGREPNYEPDEFPVVTTGNDEIVTYALKSVKGTNPDSIVFYADTKKKRASFPGGSDEQKVTIPGVDLCTGGCKNPPYQLYRITLIDEDLDNPSAANNFTWSLVADNIRSMEIKYFKDTAATTEVVPNGGAGQYKVSAGGTAAADVEARALRSTVQSVRLELVGMNSTPATGYVSPVEVKLPSAEQVAAARDYRQYQLATVIVPRNIGRRGIEEFDTAAPGPPSITGACTVGCGVVKVAWSAPPFGNVDGYAIIYDTDPNGTYSSVPAQVGNVLSAYVSGLDPTKTYYFKVTASNSFGSMRSANMSAAMTPINPTKPAAPAVVNATGVAPGGPALGNDITVLFKAPATNVDFNGAPVNGCGESQTSIPSAAETTRYTIHRSTTEGFTPDNSNKIFSGTLTSPGAPVVDGSGNASFTDKAAKLNCTTYYYKIRGEESCYAAAALNTKGDIAQAQSDYSIDVAGMSTSRYAPATPVGVKLAGADCSTDPCTIALEWPKVTTDAGDAGPPAVAPAAIQVNDYGVERITLVNGVPDPASAEKFTVSDPDPSGTGTVSFKDTTAPPPGPGEVYSYTVVARQCAASSVSEKSNAVKYPCGNMTIAPGAIIDGSGTQLDPWLVDGTGQVSIGVTVKIKTLTVKLYAPDGSFIQDLTPAIAGDGLSATANVPLGSNDGQTYRVAIDYIDVNDCGTFESVYFQDSPTGCCLAPWKEPDGTSDFDATVLRQLTVADGFSATAYPPNQSLVVKLRNLCGDDLDLTGLELTFPTEKPSPGFKYPPGCNGPACLDQRSLKTITFPATSGGTTIANNGGPGWSTSDVALNTLPGGTKTLIGGDSATYQVILVFDMPITPDQLTRFCAKYTRDGSVTSQACKIVPNPSTSASCN